MQYVLYVNIFNLNMPHYIVDINKLVTGQDLGIIMPKNKNLKNWPQMSCIRESLETYCFLLDMGKEPRGCFSSSGLASSSQFQGVLKIWTEDCSGF